MKTSNRTKQTGEVFTPTSLINEMLTKLPSDFTQPDKTVLDPSCGNGQFLAEVLKQKTYPNAVKDIYGVDLMADNVADTVARLAIIERYGIDPVNVDAQFRIQHSEYADNHDHKWLKNNYSSFNRTYQGTLEETDIHISVTFEYWDDGEAGVLRYTFNDGISNFNPNIVCQDALKYNYCFSKSKKSVLKWD